MLCLPPSLPSNCQPQAALTCLLSVHFEHPDRLLGPFARRRDPQTNEYILNELLTLPGEGSRYNMVLPRIMMLNVGFLAAYGEEEVGLKGMRQYVDEQEVSPVLSALCLLAERSRGSGEWSLW